MRDIYLSRIKIKSARNVENLDIDLSNSERVHLLLTGRNGSGKTAVLREINKYLVQVVSGQHGRLETFESSLKSHLDQRRTLVTNSELLDAEELVEENERALSNIDSSIVNVKTRVGNFGGVRLSFANGRILSKEEVDDHLVIAFFEAQRKISFQIPDGIRKVDLDLNYQLAPQVSDQFLQYIVNMKADRSFARDDGESDVVEGIDEWFDNFQEWLRELIGSPTLELRFDRKDYTFLIAEDSKKVYGLDKLSDGYSAILNVITEILLRMEAHDVRSYDMQGIILIDEIETHLHVELQKLILPFLTRMFPKIQFIVSTHSPFVLQSVENAVVCDLEHRIITKDLSGYSYDALIESFFYSDKYSDIVKSKIRKYEELVNTANLDGDDKDELRHLADYFSHVPKYLGNELRVKLQQILLEELDKKASAK